MPLHFIIYLVTMFCNINKGLKISKIITVVCPPLTQHEILYITCQCTNTFSHYLSVFIFLIFEV